MKIHYLKWLVFSAVLIGACNKGNDIKISSKNAALIVGKWLVYKQQVKVYSIQEGTLLKDTLINYDSSNNTNWWFEIFEANGDAFVTGKTHLVNGIVKADTTAFLRYTINGTSLTIRPNGGGSETKTILDLTANTMTLGRIYNSLPRPGWGLHVSTEYNFTQQTFYRKE